MAGSSSPVSAILNPELKIAYNLLNIKLQLWKTIELYYSTKNRHFKVDDSKIFYAVCNWKHLKKYALKTKLTELTLCTWKLWKRLYNTS